MNWAYWAQPKPIAVRDGQSIGLSRYAKLERGNLNSPKSVAVRDDRSFSTIAVRYVFREPDDYFNHRVSRSFFLGGVAVRDRSSSQKSLYIQDEIILSTLLHLSRLKSPYSTILALLHPFPAVGSQLEPLEDHLWRFKVLWKLQERPTCLFLALNRFQPLRAVPEAAQASLRGLGACKCLNPRGGSIPQVNVLREMELKRRRTGILNVKVIEGIGVRRMNPFAACNPYVILRLSHTDLQSMNKTTVKLKKRRYPLWNEEFSFNVENVDVQTLFITVMSAQSVCQIVFLCFSNYQDKHDYLGRTEIELKRLGPEIPETHNMPVRTKRNGFNVCKLKLETVYKPLAYGQPAVNEYLNAMQKHALQNPDGRGLLVVIIHEARYLTVLNTCSAYVSLLFNGELRKTKVCYF
ncbi:hypothetical protein E3N88_19846 [Mikania micrantha]|uniref:C2 domain-containing protein n=1 Tax=Mikania micrantha TaxID=192012 RepID=A0A5N6NR02_9ASTR|nr:hypothetical protein E3N88_19846 [Mikania micrantha]